MNELILCTSDLKRNEYTENKLSRLLNAEKKIIVIVPEQYTFSTERRFLTLFGEDQMRKISVVSFKRLSKIVFAKTGAFKYTFIGQGGKNALLLKAVSEVSPLLKYYPEKSGSMSFISLVGNAISEMKISGLSADELNKTAVLERNDKLYDISLFASAYSALLTDGNFDSDDHLSVLANEIQKTDLFCGAEVLCDKFSLFLSSEKEVLYALAKNGANLTVTLPSPSLNEPKYSLFSVISKAAATFKADAAKQGIDFCVNTISDTFSGRPEDLSDIAKHLYLNGISDKEPSNISLYKATDILDEADRTAAKISEMVRDEGYRYDDFIVITRENEQYSAVLEPAFNKYGVPLFCHQRVPLRIKPLSSLTDALFCMAYDGYRREYVIAFLKTGLTALSEDDVAAFEAYVNKWKISYGRFLSDFTMPTENEDAELLARINGVRRYVVEKTEEFKRNAENGSVKKISEALFEFFNSIELIKALEKTEKVYSQHEEYALLAEQKQIYDLTLDALDELVAAAGDDKVDLREFRDLFFSVIEENDIGIIPTAINEVTTGSIGSVPLNRPKVAFVLGLSDGDFPKTGDAFSLFDDNDRVLLEKHGVELGKTDEEKIIHEQYLAYMALTAPTEKLFLSYSGTSAEQTHPSSAITEMQRIFPMLKYEDPFSADCPQSIVQRLQNEASAFDIYARFGSKKLEEYFKNTDYNRFLNNQERTLLEQDTAKRLFGKDMKLSASRVAKYYECGFSYFCEYGLGLKQKREKILGALEVGNYMHFVLQRAIKIGLGTDEQIKQTAEDLASEYISSMFGNAQPPAGFMTYFRRLVQKSVRLLVMFRDELAQSKFVPVDFEVEINDSGKVKPVVIPVEGGSIRLVGIADRVDIFEKDEKKYIRIIDYKSGSKTFDLQYVYYGLDVQMLMYLCALNENGESVYGQTKPAGCMYVGANPKIVAIDKAEDEAAAERKSRKNQLRSGLFLDNTAVLNAMDDGLGGRYIPVKAGSKNNPLVTEEEFGKLFTHIKKLLENMAVTLLKGGTAKNPVKTKKKDSCAYCVYRQFCINDGLGRGMEKIGFDNIFEKMDEEQT